MKIAICGSMQFSSEMLEAKVVLEGAGHECFVPEFVEQYAEGGIKYDGGIEAEHKREHDLIRKHFELIEGVEAVLVVNHTKKGIPNYIGANTFLEIGCAYGAGKSIFVLNPLPEMPYIIEELEAMEPIVLNGEFSRLSEHADELA